MKKPIKSPAFDYMNEPEQLEAVPEPKEPAKPVQATGRRSQNLSRRLVVQFNPQEYEELEAVAQSMGLTVSSFVRMIIKKEIKRTGD